MANPTRCRACLPPSALVSVRRFSRFLNEDRLLFRRDTSLAHGIVCCMRHAPDILAAFYQRILRALMRSELSTRATIGINRLTRRRERAQLVIVANAVAVPVAIAGISLAVTVKVLLIVFAVGDFRSHAHIVRHRRRPAHVVKRSNRTPSMILPPDCSRTQAQAPWLAPEYLLLALRILCVTMQGSLPRLLSTSEFSRFPPSMCSNKGDSARCAFIVLTRDKRLASFGLSATTNAKFSHCSPVKVAMISSLQENCIFKSWRCSA